MREITTSVMLTIMLFAGSAHAAWFNATIYAMPSEQNFISRPIYNDTPTTNLYTASAYKIDKPGLNGEHKINNQEPEIIWTPLRFTLAPGGTEYFKLYYRGPKDDQERYYRVEFREAPVRLFPLKSQGAYFDVLPVVAMSTVLVVRPRDARFAYTVDEKSGTIVNTGNTFFKVIIQRGCHGDDETALQFNMLPGERYHNPAVSAKNRKFITAGNRYLPLGTACFNP